MKKKKFLNARFVKFNVVIIIMHVSLIISQFLLGFVVIVVKLLNLILIHLQKLLATYAKFDHNYIYKI